MKFTVAGLTFAAFAATASALELSRIPMQTFYIPLLEEELFNDLFKVINSVETKGNVLTLVSIGISTDNVRKWHFTDCILSRTFAHRSRHLICSSFSFLFHQTVIWYDHVEDGFDIDSTNSTLASGTTQIWGDGIASNGCRPDITTCTDSSDILNAGANIVLRNTVEIPRNVNKYVFDGGDRVQASFPVAMTRGAYPESPGSL